MRFSDRRLLVGLGAGAAMIIAAAPAQANWGPQTTASRPTCGRYAKVGGLLVQECVLAAPTRSSVSAVQSLMAVSNRNSGARRVRGETYQRVFVSSPGAYS